MAKQLNKNLVGGLTFLAFVVITAAGVFMASALQQTDPQEFVKQAERFASEANYERAATYYYRAFQASEDPSYLVDFGNMRELDGDEGGAIQAWVKAVTYDPDLLEAHEKILSFSLPFGNWLEAKKTAETILRLEDKNPAALHGLGRALIELEGQPEGDRDKGFEYLEQAHQIAPEVYEYGEQLAGYYWRDANTRWNTDPDRAEQQAGAALELVRDFVAANETPGEDAANARIFYAQLLSSAVGRPREALFSKVFQHHLGAKDRFAEADKLFEQAIEMAGDSPEVQSDALTASARHRYQQSIKERGAAGGAADDGVNAALELARQAIEIWPKGFNSYLLLALMHAELGEPQKAAQACIERTELPIERKGLQANRQKAQRVGLLLFAANQLVIATASPGEGPEPSVERDDLLAQADELVRDARAEMVSPERHAWSLHILGKIELAKGNDLDALKYLEKADQVGPSGGEQVLQNKALLGILRYRQGDIGGAREALSQAILNPRADARTWLAMAKVNLDFQELERALLAADEALKRDPNIPGALEIKIAANQQLGRADLVSADLEKMGGSGPRQATFRARVYVAQGKHQEAFDLLKEVVTQDPTSEEAWQSFAAIARQMGKQPEALSLLEEALQSDPENFVLQTQAVYLDPDLGPEEQRERMLALIEQTPDEYMRAYRLGEFYRTVDDPAEAMRHFGKAAQLLINRKTERAQRAGQRELLDVLQKQFMLAVGQKLWDQVDALEQQAIELNADGAQGMTFRGRARLARGDYAAAIEAFKLALEEQPSQSESWGWLGQAQYLANRRTEAQASFLRAAELDPGNFMAQRQLAELAKAAGDLDEFNNRLDQCLRLNPDDAWVKAQELARQEERDPQEGIARRQALFEQKPDDLANLVQLAHLYQLIGDKQKAGEFYTAALKHPDTQLGIAWRAARFYAQTGDRDRAFQLLGDHLDRSETPREKALVLLMTATLYRELGELPDAERALRQAVDLDPGENTFTSFAEHYLSLEQYGEAIKWLEKGIEAADQAESARAPRVRRVRFDALLKMGDRDAAQAAVQEYRDRYPTDPMGDVMESELLAVSGAIDQAIALLTRYLQTKPGEAAVLYRRAQHYASRQKWREAIADLEKLSADQPDALDYSPRMLLAHAYDRTDRPDLARSELRTLYEERPQNADICRQYFDFYMKHERYADAESLATALVNREPANPAWHRALAQAAARLQDGAKALASFRDAAERSNYGWPFCALLLESCAQFDNEQAGIRFYEETLPPDKRVAPLTCRYANLLARAGRTDVAVAAYRQALAEEGAARDTIFVSEVALHAAQALGAAKVLPLFQAEPADENLKRANQHILAALYVNMDKGDEAMAILDALAKTAPSDLERSSLHGRRGTLAEMQRDYALAQRCYEEALKYYPDNFFVLNNLAFLLTDKLGQAKEAVAYAERAVQLADRKEVVDTLAWTLVELGDYGRAIGLLSRAVQRDLEFIPALVHMGEAYRRSRKFDEAEPQFEHALKLMEVQGDDEYREQAEIGLQKARDQVFAP